jgi:hypothetical protein
VQNGDEDRLKAVLRTTFRLAHVSALLSILCVLAVSPRHAAGDDGLLAMQLDQDGTLSIRAGSDQLLPDSLPKLYHFDWLEDGEEKRPDFHWMTRPTAQKYDEDGKTLTVEHQWGHYAITFKETNYALAPVVTASYISAPASTPDIPLTIYPISATSCNIHGEPGVDINWIVIGQYRETSPPVADVPDTSWTPPAGIDYPYSWDEQTIKGEMPPLPPPAETTAPDPGPQLTDQDIDEPELRKAPDPTGMRRMQ